MWRSSGGGKRIETVGDPNQSSMICSNVTAAEDYIVVSGVDSFGSLSTSDRAYGKLPNASVYVFRKLPSATQSDLGFVGAAPNYGFHGEIFQDIAIVVKNYKDLGDILIVGSEVRHSSFAETLPYYKENKAMLDAVARALGFRGYEDHETKSGQTWYINQTPVYPDKDNAGLTLEEALRLHQQLQKTGLNTEVTISEATNPENVQSGAKIAVYALEGQITPYDATVRLPPAILKKIAVRPVMLAREVKLTNMQLVSRDGELMLELIVSAENPGTVTEYTSSKVSDMLQGKMPEVRTAKEGGGRYTVGPVQIPLSEIVTNGILPATPLLK
ncbi:hypothetical protein HYY73_00300 [Candidatus Woesearchaeota archaeon]|nr:hypothetical protein [Candidatus Woesearchaeota archaeon]